MEKIYCVISHTHWDREWYKPFEWFRMHLCDLINNLFDIIKEYPDYVFHLDAQTIVLEDYLEIYPQNRGLLEKYIKNGNIIVGPWYMQNDYYLTSGESTIRNLLVGTKLAESFGACGKTGYSPDQFGNISQLPQILNNFGIDNFVFGRGFSPYGVKENGEKYLKDVPSEFIWQGPDGSEVLAIHLKDWYNNAQRFSADISKAKQLINNIEKSFEGVAVSPYLLLMNGVDHLEAQEDLLPILDKLNKEDINGEIKQMLMSDYIDAVRGYVKDNDKALNSHLGELRQGGDDSILQGTLSSRSYLKRQNVEAQDLLENRLEPLYSMLELSGFKGIYPKNYMHYLWKLLMQNHPHDSICGCSRDEVHSHMEDRYKRIGELGSVLLKQGMELAAYHNGGAASDKSAYSLVLANTVNKAYSGLAKVVLRFPEEEKVENFIITDKEGKAVDFAVVSCKRELFDIFSPINLPGKKYVYLYEAYIPVKDMKPLSFATYKVTPCEGKISLVQEGYTKDSVLENEHLRVEIQRDGRVDVLCKETGRKMQDCLRLEDTADKGDSYTFVSANDKPVTNRDFVPVIEMTENNKYRQACTISYNMELPAFYDFEKDQRSKATATTTCELTLSLEKGARSLNVSYKINNKSSDHRLRLLVKTDAASDEFTTDIPFDIITRKDDDLHPHVVDNCHPNTSFAAIEEGEKGIAVFTCGEHECSKTDKDTLAFTLVRSTHCIFNGNGVQWQTPENQCLRTIAGNVGIYPYQPSKEKSLTVSATSYKNPVLTCCVPCDSRKFTGGRPAVQDSKISELFFREDPYSKVSLCDGALVSVDNEAVSVSAFKLSEDGKCLVLRLFNTSNREASCKVCINGKIHLSDMNEKGKELVGTNSVTLDMRPKQIITLLVD